MFRKLLSRRSRPMDRPHHDQVQFPESSSFKPSTEDVAFVRRTLQTRGRLPPELADMILDEAEYWSCANVRRVCSLTSHSHGPLACWLYLVTPTVPARAKKLKFTTQSHDQGWSGEDPMTRGTYHCSYTWFDVAILRPDSNNTESDTSVELSDTLRTVREEGPKDVSEDKEDWPGQGWKVVPGSQQLLQRNVHCTSDFKVHEIVWRKGTKGKETWDEETGAGRGVGFMDALRPGDRIAVLAKAQFPAWRNVVNGIQAEVFWSDA